MTRILLQYYITENEAILKELKTWLAGMNEIQREVLSDNVLKRAKYYREAELLIPCKDLYDVFREYAQTSKAEEVSQVK